MAPALNASMTSLPPLIFSRYRPLAGDWQDFTEYLRRPEPTVVWPNPLRLRPGELEKLLRREGIVPTPLPWGNEGLRLPPEVSPGRLWLHAAGLLRVQEGAAALAVPALDPRPGERVLDLCAAPGNKTAQISFAVGPAGTVVANDTAVRRMRSLRSTVERLGLLNVVTTLSDGKRFPFEAGPFDRVLVDAPCSGEGRSRRSFDRVTPPSFARKLQSTQRALLHRAVRLCRAGGRIAYATCTYAPEENEAVVDAVLRRFAGELRVVPVEIPGIQTSPGTTSWQGTRFDPSLESTLRIWPHQNDTGGFYIACLEKLGGEVRRAEMSSPGEGEEAAGDPWRELLGETYGIPPAAFAHYRFERSSSQRVYAATRALEVPPWPPLHPCGIQACGIHAVGLKSARPKLTTAGALAFGRAATRGVVELEHRELRHYLRRHDVALPDGRVPEAGGERVVIVRYLGHAAGTAFVGPEGRLASYWPKAWALDRAAREEGRRSRPSGAAPA